MGKRPICIPTQNSIHSTSTRSIHFLLVSYDVRYNYGMVCNIHIRESVYCIHHTCFHLKQFLQLALINYIIGMFLNYGLGGRFPDKNN